MLRLLPGSDPLPQSEGDTYSLGEHSQVQPGVLQGGLPRCDRTRP